jgi:SET domain-containing protein
VIYIKYQLKESPLHGVGLFSDQDIKEGELVLTASPMLDVDITQEQFDSLRQSEQDEVRWWGYFYEPSQIWHVDFDVSRFINHSYDATLKQDEHNGEPCLVAARDVKAGEELTQNYLEIETPDDLARRGIA